MNWLAWALMKEGLPAEVWAGMCSLGEGGLLCRALIRREIGVAYLLSKKLTWYLMLWKPSSRGMGLGMVTRRKE